MASQSKGNDLLNAMPLRRRKLLLAKRSNAFGNDTKEVEVPVHPKYGGFLGFFSDVAECSVIDIGEEKPEGRSTFSCIGGKTSCSHKGLFEFHNECVRMDLIFMLDLIISLETEADRNLGTSFIAIDLIT